MAELYRFGVSLEKQLIDAFDKDIESKNYNNRSEAIRDLIREELLRKKWDEGGEVAGAIVMTYDHHKRELVSRLMDIQHDFHDLIISSQHVHLDHHHCLEILAVRGNSTKVRSLADEIKALKGVDQVTISAAATGHPCK